MAQQVFGHDQPLSAPIFVFLNLTKECNMRCVYCYAETTRPSREQSSELTDAELLALVDQLVTAKVFRYALTGGEPFLRRELVFEILSRVTRAGHALLFTNGTLIRPEDARRLAAFAGRLAVYLSIDAPDEEANAVTRGRGFLAKTLRGAERLRRAGLEPEINCVLSRTNRHRIPEMVEFLKREGFRKLHIIHLQELGYASALSELVLNARERLAFSEDLCYRIKPAEEEVEIIAGDDENWLGFERALTTFRERGGYNGDRATLLPCSAGVEQCNVTADGWVTPCNYMHSYHCGNIRQQDFLTIWRTSPELQRIRALRDTPVTSVDPCSSCDYSLFCRGGCRALGYAGSGDLLGLDPTCPYAPQAPRGERELLPIVQ